MPEWLTGFLQVIGKEGSALAIMFAVGWLVFRHLANQQKDHLASSNAKHESEISQLVAFYDKLAASKDSEIARLIIEKEAIQKDREALYKMIKAEHKKP